MTINNEDFLMLVKSVSRFRDREGKLLDVNILTESKRFRKKPLLESWFS